MGDETPKRPETVEKSISAIYSACLGLFEKDIHPSDKEPLACSLHQSFEIEGKNLHNCLGCNFVEVTGWIAHHLQSIQSEDDAAEPMTFYLLKLYLFVERAYEIFEIINLPESYRGRHFQVFKDVHKWANFIKHPKAFSLVHHPSYFFEGRSDFDSTEFNLVIDQQFVIDYYSGPAKNAKLYKQLENKKDIAVLYPDPLALTQRFNDAIRKFIDLIKNNEVYREVLASRTSYENYFSKEDETKAPEITTPNAAGYPERPAPFDVEQHKGKWRVRVQNNTNEWLECATEHDARAIAQFPVLNFDALESRRSGEAFAVELEKASEIFQKYRMGFGSRALLRRAQEARQRVTLD